MRSIALGIDSLSEMFQIVILFDVVRKAKLLKDNVTFQY